MQAGDAADCRLCTPGHACPSGSIAMIRCHPGSVSNQSGQAACRKCAAGTFQSSRGQQECKVCALGGYCTKGASSPVPCEAGRFGNRLGLG